MTSESKLLIGFFIGGLLGWIFCFKLFPLLPDHQAATPTEEQPSTQPFSAPPTQLQFPEVMYGEGGIDFIPNPSADELFCVWDIERKRCLVYLLVPPDHQKLSSVRILRENEDMWLMYQTILCDTSTVPKEREAACKGEMVEP